MRVSLGIIEVAGYALATIVADAMAKSSNIRLGQITRTQGAGWMTVIVTGDVGSVNAAIATGADLANKLGGLKGSKVIARPSEDVARMWLPPTVPDTAGPDANAGVERTGLGKATVAPKPTTSGSTSSPAPKADKTASGLSGSPSAKAKPGKARQARTTEAQPEAASQKAPAKQPAKQPARQAAKAQTAKTASAARSTAGKAQAAKPQVEAKVSAEKPAAVGQPVAKPRTKRTPAKHVTSKDSKQ